ncbi:hypothetical protein BH11GEM2_BH11GEM2_27550 [soil metagenome]
MPTTMRPRYLVSILKLVIPAKAGIPLGSMNMDSRVRGNDERISKARFQDGHFLALAAAAMLAGCGGDSSVATTSTPTDLAQVFREMSLPAISGATSAAAGIERPTTPLAGGVPTGCSYALASQAFVCAPITTNGITITQSYSLLNASGGSLSFFEPSSLAAVRLQSTITGTQKTGGDSLSIVGRQDQTLSGLQTSKHTLNGTTTMNLSGTVGSGAFNPSAEPLTMTMKSTTTDLVIPANADAKTYPSSGTIAVEQTMSVRNLPPLTTRIVLTFNGTSKVKLTIDGVSVSGCSTIDLAGTNPGCS